MIFRTVDLKDHIELVADLKQMSSKSAKGGMASLSQFVSNEIVEELGYYNSRHLVEVQRIVSIYKRNKAIRR